MALLLGSIVLATGCATVTTVPGGGGLLDHGPLVALSGSELKVALASPTEVVMRAVPGGAVRVDAFDYLLLLAGLDNISEELPRDATLTPQKAASVLAVLLRKPVTPGSFPPRMAVCHLLREVVAGGSVSRDELSRRVERFKRVAVLRPDGYLAWTLNGRTQQKVGPVAWKDEAFRAGPFELGRFYSSHGGVFRSVDAQLRPIMKEPPLAEEYDDADYISRTLDGAEESFVELYHAMGQLLTRPLDSLAALQRLPAGVAALIASSPDYFERFRYMTRGEQVKALSKLTTQLFVTFGAVKGTTSTLTRTFSGTEATVPVLSLSAEGALMVERVAVPVGKVATVLSGGPWAAIIVEQAHGAATGASEASRGQMLPAAEELLQQATRLPPEHLGGYRIFGNKGLVGQTFQRNILLIEADKGASLSRLIAAFEAEARAAGASRLSITGHAVINKGFLKPEIARRFGFELRLINKDTIELVKELRP